MSSHYPSGERCIVCKQPIEQGQVTMNLDYISATGRTTYPDVNSPNYDLRYGYLVHDACHDAKMARIEERKHKEGEGT